MPAQFGLQYSFDAFFLDRRRTDQGRRLADADELISRHRRRGQADQSGVGGECRPARQGHEGPLITMCWFSSSTGESDGWVRAKPVKAPPAKLPEPACDEPSSYTSSMP